MEIVRDILSWGLLLAGSAFALIGGIGLLRFPDFFTRMHAAGLTDSLGAGLILLGLMLQGGWGSASAKLLLILLLFFFTSPTATHALAKAALADALEPKLAGDRSGEELPSSKP